MPAVWLVSWQDRVRDASLNDADASEKIGKSVFVNRESCNEAFVPRAGVDSAALQQECKGPHCYGALELRPKFREHVLQHLGPGARADHVLEQAPPVLGHVRRALLYRGQSPRAIASA